MKNWKTSVAYVLVVCCSAAAPLFAQENPVNTGFGFGVQLNQYQKDFGAGLNITTPFFANEKVAVRLRGNAMFHEHATNSNGTTWSPYANVSLGVIGTVGYVGDIRLYSEGGVIALFPANDFSSKSTNFGGYGVFGFEFFFNNIGNYFIEIGGVGTGARADEVTGEPIYSNGLIIGTGFRFYLPKS